MMNLTKIVIIIIIIAILKQAVIDKFALKIWLKQMNVCLGEPKTCCLVGLEESLFLKVLQGG